MHLLQKKKKTWPFFAWQEIEKIAAQPTLIAVFPFFLHGEFGLENSRGKEMSNHRGSMVFFCTKKHLLPEDNLVILFGEASLFVLLILKPKLNQK